jgi:hypothetical protein
MLGPRLPEAFAQLSLAGALKPDWFKVASGLSPISKTDVAELPQRLWHR